MQAHMQTYRFPRVRVRPRWRRRAGCAIVVAGFCLGTGPGQHAGWLRWTPPVAVAAEEAAERVSDPQSLTQQSPAPDASEVPVDTVITATFVHALDPSTVNEHTVLLESAERQAVEATVAYDAGTQTVTLTPVAPLHKGAAYSVIMTSDIATHSGEPAMAQDISWIFNTVPVEGANYVAPESEPPQVIATQPEKDSADSFPDARISVQFSHAMDSATINASTILIAQGTPGKLGLRSSTPIYGTVSYDDSLHSAVFTPAQPLASRAQFTVTVKASVQSVARLPMAQDVVWHFSTADEANVDLLMLRPPLVGNDGGGNGTTHAPSIVRWDPQAVRLSTYGEKRNGTYTGVDNNGQSIGWGFLVTKNRDWDAEVRVNSQTPGTGNDSLATWYLVDWNGGNLKDMDTVSFATRSEKYPWYLTSTWQSVPAQILSATRSASSPSISIGATETFIIVKDRARSSAADDIIRNGDAIALQNLGAWVSWSPSALISDAAVGAGYNGVRRNTETWRIWFKIRPQEGGDFPGNPNWCFGGVGAGCWNNPFTGGGNWSWSCTNGVCANYKRIFVNPGSIGHDNCCLRQPLGKNCAGVFQGGETTNVGGVFSGIARRGQTSALALFQEEWLGSFCSREWDKAFYGMAQGQKWLKTFGPYYGRNYDGSTYGACPNCTAVGWEAWGLSGDVLSKAPTNRRFEWWFDTWPIYAVDNPYAGQAEVTRYPVYPATETILAPRNTPIANATERGFCQSNDAFWIFLPWAPPYVFWYCR